MDQFDCFIIVIALILSILIIHTIVLIHRTQLTIVRYHDNNPDTPDDLQHA